MTSGRTLSRLTPFLQIIGGVGALLAVAGYASQRSRLNYLGITGIGNIPTEHYLYEAYTFMITAMAMLLISAAAVVPVCVIFWFLLGADRGGFVRSKLLVAKPFLFPAIPVFAAASILALFPPLSDGHVLLRPAAEIPPSQPRQEWVLASLGCLNLTISCITSKRAMRSCAQTFGVGFARAVRLLAMVGALMLLWCSIVLFNVYGRDLKFPLAMVSDKSGKVVICGSLLLTTNDEYVLWTVATTAGHRGNILLLRRSDQISLRLGEWMNAKDFANTFSQICSGAMNMASHVGQFM